MLTSETEKISKNIVSSILKNDDGDSDQDQTRKVEEEYDWLEECSDFDGSDNPLLRVMQKQKQRDQTRELNDSAGWL